jgi:dynein heavy chain
LGIGDWGLGIGPNPQSPIPNPQSPSVNKILIIIIIINNYFYIISLLLSNGKKPLMLGYSRDGGCGLATKDFKTNKKLILILRASKETQLPEELDKHLVFIEITKNMLEQMYIVCKDIFYPMLNQTVYSGETELISKDLMEKFHNFLAHFYVCLGQRKGNTLLPVPSDEIFRNTKINDNEKTQICEGAVVMWIELIKHNLKQEPEYDFRNGNHPKPLSELEFWDKKSANLESILLQINSDQVLEILKFLEKQKSSYSKFFNEIKKDVIIKSKEATQNSKFLKFLKKDLSEFENESLSLADKELLFFPIFQSIRFIWRDNEYYSKPERLIVLIRKLCNSLIEQCRNFITRKVFSLIQDIENSTFDTLKKLEDTRETISKFMSAYFSYKDMDSDGWKITRQVIFYRLDAFNERLGDIYNIGKSYFEFSKLKGKFVGGVRGKTLMDSLDLSFNECEHALNSFSKDETFDPLDIGDEMFTAKNFHYKEFIKELEKRVSAILTQSFEECDTIIGKFKVLENFDTILERPNIIVELEKNYNILLDLYKNDLKIVQGMFLTGKEFIENNDPRSPLNKKMPPIAALLYWTDSLKERIREPYKRFQDIGKRITEKEEFREIDNLYKSILSMIQNYEKDTKIGWDSIAKQNSGDKQKDFILVKRDEFISINFDRELIQLLKEIKYLKVLNMDIPDEAEEVYKKNNEFRNIINALEAMTSKYNNIISSLNEVEKPLIQESLDIIDKDLVQGFSEITWENSEKIRKFILLVDKKISDLNLIVDKLKGFVQKIESVLKDWREKKLFTRPKKVTENTTATSVNDEFIANFDRERTHMGNKTKEITNLNDVFQALRTAVKAHNKFKESPKWKKYQHFINSIIIKGIIDLIYENMENLENCLNPSIYPEPFCTVKMVLDYSQRKIDYEPELNNPDPEKLSIKSILVGWINSFINLATLIRNRVDTGSGDYMLEVLENFSIQEMIYRLYNEVNNLISETNMVIDNFVEFKPLWEKSFEETFNEFLEKNTPKIELSEDDLQREEKIKNIFPKGNPILNNVKQYTPNKENFDDKINELKSVLKKVKNIDKNKTIRWIILDFTEFKFELVRIIEKLIMSYKDFLKTNSSNKIANIKTFMNNVKKGITNIPLNTDNEKNKKAFISLLENIRDMKCLYPVINQIIPTILDELDVLKKHSKVEGSEDDIFEDDEKDKYSEEQKLINETLDIKNKIVELFKETEKVYQDINDLVEKESSKFKVQVLAFQEQVEKYKEDFKSIMPTKIVTFDNDEIDRAYKILDENCQIINNLEKKKKENNDMELLLNLQLSQNKSIMDCRSDLLNNKNMWDYVSLIYHTFSEWKTFKFNTVDVNPLLERIDIFKQMMKKVPIRIKSIPIFGTLDKIKIVEMDNTIQVVQTLKEKVIKSRHWKQVMKLVGNKHINYDSNDFCIADIYDLEMFKYKDAIENEKSIATTQDQIENKFLKIDKVWQSQKFEMTKTLNNKEYDIFLFNHSGMEGIIENMEKDQVDLTQMAAKKAVLENFEGMEAKIVDLLEKLQMINAVTKCWLKLQKNWERLETIFMKSPDIQKTLREQSQKFKDFDAKFRDDMKFAYDYNSMIDLCKIERLKVLEDWSSIIAECEQALDNYLGEKKVIFPRFFFLSNDTLLNMLSYGEYPNIINKNVKDCFDGIKYWLMEPVDSKNCSRTILGMLSSDNDEEVIFEEPFICEGALVEIYLLNFEAKMRKTLKDVIFISRTIVEWSPTGIKPPTYIDINSIATTHRNKIKAFEEAGGFYDKSINKKLRHYWLEDFPAQVSLLITMNIWTEEVEHAFEELEGGGESAMRDYLNTCKDRISELIKRVKTKIRTRDLRAKIITVITVDVHSRDVVDGFVEKKITDLNNFNWKKQLRFYYDFKEQNYDIRIADYSVKYSYEYIGNTGRLVITPLTDRCYITLTQALNLDLGGAPAGPAGTGKTETTKDLSRNLGLGIIVQNCSDQMDVDTTARIFSGLTQTGFWGCFDEFNTISIEVLSVIASQVRTILDALRKRATTVFFDGTEIKVVRTVGFFITMNPGYAGRQELPDNLKASFRYCAMVVPELMLICENMLMSEGFIEAKVIARKFITLYNLSRDLLSKSKHYDWGLRAIKSLLRQAGGLKRQAGNEEKTEQYIISKALYDFNKAKIINEDMPIFNRLLDDLFKGVKDDPRNKEEINTSDLDNEIEIATEYKTDLNDKNYHKISYQKDASFTLKTRQLEEVVQVRHCVFILGETGSGKTAVWKTLFHRYRDVLKYECAYEKLSPKAVSKDELLGSFDKNKVWRYGILSSFMKKMSKNDPPYKASMKIKWIILDGDIDPKWIEAMNTVMDDNKVLTLSNGDRFPLDEYMRLLLEVSNLRNATLATVTRGGVLFLNDNEIGIKPFFEKWISNRYSSEHHEITRSVLNIMFKETFEKIKYDLRESYIAPQVDINIVQNICTIFQNQMSENANIISKSANNEEKRKSIEGIYLFSFMWGMGGPLINRSIINTVVKNAAPSKIRFPENGMVFDYYFECSSNTWQPWSKITPEFNIPENSLFENIIVPNTELVRLNKVVEINMLEEKPVLFIADAGNGKTSVAKYFLNNIKELSIKNPDFQYKSYISNFNSYTDSLNFQSILESQISQRVGNKIGPPANTKLIYFLDDMNMPALDYFGTQSHVELLRQVIDYKEFYDRKDLEVKKVLEDILFIASQNPKAGSFKIDSRCQRHFTVLVPSEPKEDVIRGIYGIILQTHFKEFKFKGFEKNAQQAIIDLSDQLINASFRILDDIRKHKDFAPNAQKFHYQWNLRECAKLINGLLRTNNNYYKDFNSIYKLWYHECNRVFKDRLKFADDFKRYDDIVISTFDREFKYVEQGDDKKPTKENNMLIFVPFDEHIEEEQNILFETTKFENTKEFIKKKLDEYNESKTEMNLVLFEDAVKHVCRISRIISNPSSHGLLVGVGGSGRQSLSRLAAFIKNITPMTPDLTVGDYNRESLVNDFKTLVNKAAVQGSNEYCFLINDNHILEEYFLVYINDFLSSGWIDDIFESKDALMKALTSIKVAAKNEGFYTGNDPTPEQLTRYLIYRIKKNIHIVLCMSPVGDSLRIRIRKFPGILNCTSIDWFHPWPEDALVNVSLNKISELGSKFDSALDKIASCTALIHSSLNKFNDLFFKQERRHNYTTPKSFLELINFFKLIVTNKDDEIEKQINRLTKGVDIIFDTSLVIEDLKLFIKDKSVQVEIEKENTKKVMEELAVENELVSGEMAIVKAATDEADEKMKTAKIEMDEADAALSIAKPIKEQALLDAQNIDEKKLNEFKNTNSPSDRAKKVFQLIYFIFFPTENKIPEFNTIKSKALSQDAKTIKNSLVSKLSDVGFINDDFLRKVDEWTKGEWTDMKQMNLISPAVGNLMSFFHNLIKYRNEYLRVKPIEEKAISSKKIADEAEEKARELNEKLEKVLMKKKLVEARYDESVAKKEAVEKEQADLQFRLDRAEMFITLLSSNNKRWKEEIEKLKVFRQRLAGDCLLAASFVSYIGVFNNAFRDKCLHKWKEIIKSHDIILSDNIDLVSILITNSQILNFKSEGLPADPFSTENAAIMTSCTRWPLVIDPQMQAIKWLKGMSGKKTVVQYRQFGWDKLMGDAIFNGDIIIVEDVDNEIDPGMVPILAKETYKKSGGRAQYMKVGQDEVEFHQNTKIYFITKIMNPHFKPEVIAQATFINFIVTEKGLEDQLLALVVNIEQPESEEKIKELVDQINKFQRELITREDEVLRRLEDADRKEILNDVELINSLKSTKEKSNEIEESSKITEEKIAEINKERENYRKVGEEGAMLFFIISKLFFVQFTYQYSLDSFTYFYTKAINETPKYEHQSQRIKALRENIRLNIYLWVTSGMFERDKPLFMTMIALRLLQKNAIEHEDCIGITQKHIDFLLKCPQDLNPPMKNNQFAFLDDVIWRSMNYLSTLENFNEFAMKMMNEQSTKFKEWFNEVNPEDIGLPLDWKRFKKHSFFKILVLRCCRPDRCLTALNEFVRECLPRGREFLESKSFIDILNQAYNDSNSHTPIFFILSPGSNPINELKTLGKSLKKGKNTTGYELDKNFHQRSMGQKMDVEAEGLLRSCNQDGHWLFLQNIHLMPNWLKRLQDKLKELAKDKGSDDFRLFLSAEPREEIPVGILEKSIKLTNEPPSSLKENMKIALNVIKNDNQGSSNKLEDDRKRIAILFGLCYYHSVLLERKKFGSLGWNRTYPFNLDDLRNSDQVVYKYVTENSTGSKIPWDDLRYIIGEIMYGGHIVDDWDRRLNNSYLEYLLVDKINEDLDLVPYPSNNPSIKVSLKTPINNAAFPFDKWIEYIEEAIKSESPAMFGLHPNAELDFRRNQSEALFMNLAELEPKDTAQQKDDEKEGGAIEDQGDSVVSISEKVQEKITDGVFNIIALLNNTGEDRDPFKNVFIQECEQMKNLCEMIKKNTYDIKEASEGRLTMSELIEKMIDSLKLNRVPPKWIADGFASERKLGSWIISIDLRISQLKYFETELLIPRVVFLNRLFNPLSYLTAIRQVFAQKANLELDKVIIITEPTIYYLDNTNSNLSLQKDSYYVFGLHLQGARWDDEHKNIEESRPREDYCVMPVINCKGSDSAQGRLEESKSAYLCPVYKTTDRMWTFVTTAIFKTKVNPNKWTIAGVACILDVEKTDFITKIPK